MKKNMLKKNNLKKVLIIISIVFACILLFNLGILLFTPWEESQISKYDNINLYINNSYDTLSEYDLYQRTSANCKKFIPAYKDFEYKQHITGFYVFDGTGFRQSFGTVWTAFRLAPLGLSDPFARCDSCNVYPCPHIEKSKSLFLSNQSICQL